LYRYRISGGKLCTGTDPPGETFQGGGPVIAHRLYAGLQTPNADPVTWWQRLARAACVTVTRHKFLRRTYMVSRKHVLAITEASVSLSVCHILLYHENGASQNHGNFTACATKTLLIQQN